MPIILPVLLGGAALGAAGYGIKRGYDGLTGIKRAKRNVEGARAKHEDFVQRTEAARTEVNGAASMYGELKLRVRQDIFGRLITVLRKLERRGTIEQALTLAGVTVSAEAVGDFEAQYLQADSTLKSMAVAGAAGAAAGYAAWSGAASVGVAGTGAAITGLSGAAATNATLAWLGGGSLASGGFGMAGGMVVLGGVIVGPALAVTGVYLAKEGEKALKQAAEYTGKTEAAVATLRFLIDFLGNVKLRIEELHALVVSLRERAHAALRDLESIAELNVEDHAQSEALRHAMVLAAGLSEIMNASVLTEDGKIDVGTATIIGRYRHLAS